MVKILINSWQKLWNFQEILKGVGSTRAVKRQKSIDFERDAQKTTFLQHKNITNNRKLQANEDHMEIS